MKPILLLTMLLLGLTRSSSAREVEGIPFPDQIIFRETELILNGTAKRTLYGFGVYVAGLYLDAKSSDAAAIMERNDQPKRLRMVMLRAVPGEKLATAVHDNVAQNFTDAERVKFAAQLELFFAAIKQNANLDVGSEILIDYVPDKGTVIQVEGKTIETIAGREFYHALLRLWIGKPLQASIKTGLLGN